MAQKYTFEPWEPPQTNFTFEPWEPPDKSYLQQWDDLWINQPNLSKIRVNDTQIYDPAYAANFYDDPMARTEDQWKIPAQIPIPGTASYIPMGLEGATWRSLGAGMLEGGGKFVDSMSSLFNLGTAGVFKGANYARNAAEAAESGISALAGINTARRLTNVGRVLSAPVAAHGATDIYQGVQEGDWGKAALGVPQLAGGVAGMIAPSPQFRGGGWQERPPSVTDMGNVPPRSLPPSGGFNEPIWDDFRPRTPSPEPPPITPDIPSERPDVAGPFTEERIPVQDGVVRVDIKLAQKPSFIQNMADDNYKLIEVTRDGIAVFKKFLTEDKGTFDPGEMFQNLQRILGRAPTPDEVDRAMERQVQPGEETGRVAPFIPPTVPEDTSWMPFSSGGIQDERGRFIDPNSPVKQITESDIFSPENMARMESDNPPLIDDQGGTDWEEYPPSGVPETPIDQAKLQEFLTNAPWKQPPEKNPEIQALFREAMQLGINPDHYRSLGELADAVRNGTLGGEMRRPRQVHEIAERLRFALAGNNEEEVDRLLDEAEIVIRNETDPVIISDNLEQLDGYVEDAKSHGTPDDVEFLGQLRDLALDKVRQGAQPGPEFDQIISQAGGRVPFEQGKANIYNPAFLEEAVPEYDRNVIEPGQQHLPLGPIQALRQQSQLENVAQAPITQEMGPEQTELDFRPPEQMMRPEEPQEMRVKGVRHGNTNLENIAMGGADPRVLDVVGSSMYSRERPVTVIKELMQNFMDEHNELGITEPGRVLIDSNAPNPVTGGAEGKSITVRDRGRGLTAEQMYTVLTDLGKTGKAGVKSAAGGFGFAKAAPFLGGSYTRVISVVDTPGGVRRRFTFEGTPEQLKNQDLGVALNEEKVSNKVPTGLEVYTFYDSDISGFYKVHDWAKNMMERSTSSISGVKVAMDYGSSPKSARRWLDETPENPIQPHEHNYPQQHENFYKSKVMPTRQDSISVPGADINIHYDIEPGLEAARADIHLMNKGMYQGTDEVSYGESTTNVPRSIVADINATVEEGHRDYPFSANREQINDKVKDAIDKWVRDNIVTGVTKKRVAAIQKQYDAISTLDSPIANHNMYIYDDGNRFTPEELEMLRNHPELNRALDVLEEVHNQIMEVADAIGWGPEHYSATWRKPSERLKKFGLLIQGADRNGTTLGIHVPRPDDLNNSAILINLFEHLLEAESHPTPIDKLTTTLFATLAHEIAHIPGGGHDKGFAYRDAQLRSKLGEELTTNILDKLGEVFDDGRGEISPAISDILSIYNESRQRPPSGTDAILPTGISSTRRPNPYGGEEGNTEGTRAGKTESGLIRNERGALNLGPAASAWRNIKQRTGWGQGSTKYGRHDPEEMNFIEEILAIPTNLTTTMDLSAPGRQGLALINTKEFWIAAGKMLRHGITQRGFERIDAEIKRLPVMQEMRNADGSRIPSIAAKAGLKQFRPASEGVGPRAEKTASRWLETGGNIPYFSKMWRHTAGVPIRASNRMYITFLNHLTANRFQYLMDIGRKMTIQALDTGSARPGLIKQKFTPEEAIELNPYQNELAAKEIADFVNTATGHAPLKSHFLPHKQAEISVEPAARVLRAGMFSPGLFASRFRILNPNTYVMASPFVRKQYLKALFAVAAGWFAMTELIKNSGDDDVEVSNQITSSDFGKVRVHNTRLDAGGGFSQWLVLYGRMYNGGYRSSSSLGQEYHSFGKGFQAETQFSNALRFASNKLNPLARFAYDVADATEYRPFHVGDRTMQMFIPLLGQDMYELAKEDPELLGWIIPVAFGLGTQTYEQGQSTYRMIPPEKDWIVKGGGGIRSLMPWNWGEAPEESGF